MNNRGSAVIEATLILPIFLFGMLAIYEMGRVKMAEAKLYDACSKMCEYMAEYGYISDAGATLPPLMLQEYIDDTTLVNKYIKGGVSGVSFAGSVGVDKDGYTILKATYDVAVSLPFVPELSKKREIVIKQKAYLGDKNLYVGDEEEYVYVTPNKEAYHESRACTHLKLSIRQQKKEDAIHNGLTACEFCGASAGEIVYVTNEGDRYHSFRHCSGLKRTVLRVPKSEASGLAPCERCVY